MTTSGHDASGRGTRERAVTAFHLGEVEAGWMFPGQGAQFPRMGRKVARDWSAAAEAFAEADRYTGCAVSEWSQHDSGAALERTRATQLAVFTTSHAFLCAVRARLRELGLPADPVLAAGHSLGEINAFVAAGALTFEAALSFVQSRGTAFEAASVSQLGGMAAIVGLPLTQVIEICQEFGAEIANVNSALQYVVAVKRAMVASLCAAASRRGAHKAVPLPIAIASHSRWATEASKDMQKIIDDLCISRPRFPVVLNGSARVSDDIDEIRDELRSHLTAPVLWSASVRAMIGHGAEILIEIGPGLTLSRLAGHIVDCPVVSTGAFTPISDLITR